MSDLVFAASAETVMAIAPDIQVRMLEDLGRFEIAAFERARAVAGPRSPEAAAMDLRREEALQATLRQALWLGDREVRHPLRHVAAQLGIEFDETDEDWAALAYSLVPPLFTRLKMSTTTSRVLSLPVGYAAQVDCGPEFPFPWTDLSRCFRYGYSGRGEAVQDGDAEAQRLCLRDHHATSELFAPFRPHGHLQAAPSPIAATAPPTME